jgi:inorganic pyrophosphatase
MMKVTLASIYRAQNQIKELKSIMKKFIQEENRFIKRFCKIKKLKKLTTPNLNKQKKNKRIMVKCRELLERRNNKKVMNK